MSISGIMARRFAAALLLTVGLGACEDTGAAPVNNASLPKPIPGKNWLTVVAATPEGGFRVGNPAAKVKLVEYASLTCPHCKDFHAEAVDKIRTEYVATGNVSYEYRNLILNGPDYAASLLARCQGPTVFFNLVNAFYQTQAQWVEPFAKLTEADSKRLAALPKQQQFTGLALTGGLDGFVRQRGMTRAKFDQCLSDQTAVDKLADMSKVAGEKYQIRGTPAFLINDVVVDGVNDWDGLEPRLRGALAG